MLCLDGFNSLDDVEKAVGVRKGTLIMYDFSWSEQYMNKGDDTVLIASNLGTEEELYAMFPEKDDRRAEKKFLGSVWFVRMEKLWYVSPFKDGTPSLEKVGILMHCAMYVDRVVEVIYDKRKFNQKMSALLLFIQAQVPEYQGLELPKPKTHSERMMDNENKLKVIEFQEELEIASTKKLLSVTLVV
jgi:hypothetical protein